MIFRPLCIDYQSRAQEIILSERDAQARQAAASLLPHRSMARHNRKDALESNRDGERSLSVDENSNPTNSLREIFQALGPAVHPSECALRDIEPFATSLLDDKLKQGPTNKPILQEMAGMYDKIMTEKRRDVVMSLESGRSRFWEVDIPSLMLEAPSEEGESPTVAGSITEEDTLFHETMMVFLSRDENISSDSMDMPAVSFARRKKSMEWNLPTTTHTAPLFIRHQPPDLTRIHQLKNMRERDLVSFGDDLIHMFRPELKTLCDGALLDFQRDNLTISDQPSNDFSAPKFDLEAFCCDTKPKPIDYAARQGLLVSFTNFFEELDSKEDSSPPCHVLEALDDIGCCFIRMDPDLPATNAISVSTKKQAIREAISKSLNGLCTASFISSQLKLPARFESGHDIVQDSSQFLLQVDGPRFKLLDETNEQHKALPDYPSFESCLEFIESRDLPGSRNFVPRKITLESSIKLFNESSEVNLEARPTTNELMARLPSFASQWSYNPNFMEKGRTCQSRHVHSSARVSEARALKNVIDSSTAPCLFLPHVNVPEKTESTASSSHKLFSEQDTAIIKLVRSCVPATDVLQDIQLLQQQNSDYPIKQWFSSSGTGILFSYQNTAAPNYPFHLQQEINKAKRTAFCTKAQAVNREETQRTLILTGCSARRNTSAVFAYRGILTNQRVDPEVYQSRYLSMLKAKKANRSRRNSALQTRFVDMTHEMLVASLVRDGKRKKRGAQLGELLRTDRHGILDAVREKKVEPMQLESQDVSIRLTHVAAMAASVRKDSDALPENLVEKLGETLKKERGVSSCLLLLFQW
jgi:hypothetical protein